MTTHWSVYIILASDRSLYTGISNNLARRFQQHANNKGAKYFRHCQPVQLVFLESGHTRSSASRREAAIKKMKRESKLILIAHSERNMITAFQNQILSELISGEKNRCD
jgi:putative endonuclease